MHEADFSVVVFPFLKTSEAVQIGKHVFRSTDDLEGLLPDQIKAVSEIRDMLFVQGNLRVKSASYAIVQRLESHSGNQKLEYLALIREVISYYYSEPHEVFEDVFLRPEEVSLVVFTPSNVSIHLSRPKHHTVEAEQSKGAEPDRFHNVPGYNGVYNFRHLFWIEPGSRLYGPKPHMTLNISQDLHVDLQYRIPEDPGHQLLIGLLEKPDTPASLRIYSALRWYNAANEEGLDHSRVILNLAVAFETLLRLPEMSKSERLVDAISLLLGRTERLDDWAKQFYAARSRVAHEGEIRDGYFYVGEPGKKHATRIFGSLILYGRLLFRLCVSTLLVGIDLAQRADLQEKFITNNERYNRICELLNDKTRTASDRLLALETTIRTLERYRFVTGGVEPGPMLSAVQLAAQALTECGSELPDELAVVLKAVAESKRSDQDLKRLAAIEALSNNVSNSNIAPVTPQFSIVRDLVKLVWMNLFQHYYWLKNRDC